MIVLTIDPGTFKSAFVIYDSNEKKISRFSILENVLLLHFVFNYSRGYEKNKILVIEQMKSFGKALGDDVLETCVWIGRFIEAWKGEFQLIPRKTITTHLNLSPTANDSNVRMEILNRFLHHKLRGGGKTPAIGTKKQPGPLYGVKKDIFSALAIAITWSELYKPKRYLT